MRAAETATSARQYPVLCYVCVYVVYGRRGRLHSGETHVGRRVSSKTLTSLTQTSNREVDRSFRVVQWQSHRLAQGSRACVRCVQRCATGRPVATVTAPKRSRMRKKSAVGAVRWTLCVLRYRAAARAPLLHAGGTHGHPLRAAAVQEQRSSCPLVPFSPRSAAVQALDANAGVTANAWQMPCW